MDTTSPLEQNKQKMEKTNKVFEYALMDSQNNKISYVLLINPTARDLRENDKYLAIDRSIYK